jgi:CBS domain-containing protein
MQALDHMAQGGLDFLVVMENEQIVGLITRSAIAHFLELRGSLSR